MPITALKGRTTANLSIPDLDASTKTMPGGFDGSALRSLGRDHIAAVNPKLAQIAVDVLDAPILLSGEKGGLGYTLLQAGAGIFADVAQEIGFTPAVTGTRFPPLPCRRS
ncbi:MAG: hypothetical protein FJX57_13715 [Alphaproteobacteria bacterium]|nr:hypothetical protein [Alphaproteobacteria bacterium]